MNFYIKLRMRIIFHFPLESILDVKFLYPLEKIFNSYFFIFLSIRTCLEIFDLHTFRDNINKDIEYNFEIIY